MITAQQKAAIEEIIHIIVSVNAARNKRQLAGMFMDLVSRKDWPEYFEIIPEPRCLNDIKSNVENDRYKDPLDAYTDLSLVFWNALFYNEEGSGISLDAETLKSVLEAEWKKRPVLPAPHRTSPPPSSAQKVHSKNTDKQSTKPSVASTSTTTPARTRTATPARTTTPAQPPPTLHAPTPRPVQAFTPTAIAPRPPPRQSTPDMDVDVAGMSPEPDGQGEDAGPSVGTARDDESEEIVRQLEKGLPRWQGYGDAGWMEEIDPERLVDIVHTIKSYKDIIGNRQAVSLEAIPEESTLPNLSYTTPLSLKIIEGKVRAKSYASCKEFDLDMIRLFEKARRWHEPCTEPYGRVLLLQRLYQALTSLSPPPGPPYSSNTNFASLRAGPGTAKPLHTNDTEGVPGVTTFRVSNKDRTFVDEVVYKGWSIRLADWIHLSNPDDPSRPIIAQVFKVWTSDAPPSKGQPGVTACWYHRPEQTYHPAHRQFWEGEVFKTSHFADHPLEDLIEKIACQFTARHIRGRPRPPFWYPGWPLYVCDSRYNDRERVFVKIKNWNSCVPEEVRKSQEFMPIYEFERMVFPRRFGSPFLTAKSGKTAPVKGPGGIGDAIERPEAEKGDGGTGGRKRSKRTVGAGGDHAGPNKGLYVGLPGNPASGSQHAYQPSHLSQQPHQQRLTTEDRSVITAAGGAASLGGAASIEKLPAETAKHFDRDPVTNEVLWFASAPTNAPRPAAPKHSLAYLHFLATKRKRQVDDSSMDVDDDESSPARKKLPRTSTESLIRAIDKVFGSAAG
ncbi:hypothetical protein PLICRDRAFT_56043 [Plicaturopsis crispa FD-325 SS-3]|nr:hypothetical protein PLICRDRAFT_56043 [Plicaturopsis crispa FD-325 SS-3]